MPAPLSTRPPRIDRALGGVILVVILGSLMSIVDSTIVNVAIDPLARTFDRPLPVVQWVSTGYLLALTTVIPLTGWAADRFGTKRLYLGSLALFTVGSLLAGAAWSVESLIGFRVLQGLGGGMIMPVGMTMITRAAGPARLGRVMSLVGVPMLLGPIAGPLLGGVLIDHASWRWIFAINLPIGILAIVLGVVLLARDEPQPGHRLDRWGALLLPPSLALLVWGLSGVEGGDGFTAPVVWVPLAAGAGLLAGFVHHALHAESPLIGLRLLRQGAMGPALASTFLNSLGFYAMMYLLPLYLQQARGSSAGTTGLLMAPLGVGAAITTQVVGRLAHRVLPRTLVLIGVVPFAIGYAGLTLLDATTPVWLIVVLTVTAGLGAGLTQMPTMTAGLQTLAHADAARANTVFNIAQRFAGSVGVTLSTILLGVLAGGVASQAGPDVFGTVFWLPVALVLAAGAAALPLPRVRPALPGTPTAPTDAAVDAAA